MKKTMIAVAVFALGSTVAFALPPRGGGHGRHHGHHKGGDRMAKLAEKLNLSETQKQQIEEIKKATREQNAAFFETSRNTRKEMREARKANDTAKVESLKPLAQSQREQMKQIHEAQMAQIVAVLTPDQRAQFDAMKAARKEHRNKSRE